MERIKRIGLRGSFFLLALCGLAVSLVLLALLWQGCGAIAARYSNGGYIIGPGGLVERLPSPSPEEARLLERISRASRLRPTHLVDNTNLMGETTPRLLERSEEYIREVSRLTGVPVLCQAVEQRLARQLPAKGKLPVTIYVKPPWEER